MTFGFAAPTEMRRTRYFAVLRTQRKKNHELINYVYILYSVQLAKAGVTIGNFETAEDVLKKPSPFANSKKLDFVNLPNRFTADDFLIHNGIFFL